MKWMGQGRDELDGVVGNKEREKETDE